MPGKKITVYASERCQRLFGAIQSSKTKKKQSLSADIADALELSLLYLAGEVIFVDDERGARRALDNEIIASKRREFNGVPEVVQDQPDREDTGMGNMDGRQLGNNPSRATEWLETDRLS